MGYNNFSFDGLRDQEIPMPKPPSNDIGLDLDAPLERPVHDIDEAPIDIEQVDQIGERLSEIGELKYDNWSQLPYNNRCELLQSVENIVAEIEYREPCTLVFESLEANNYGAQCGDKIVLNSNYVVSNVFNDYKEVLDTIIHEGRHAYQEYNIHVQEVCGDSQIVSEWSNNFDNYISPEWDFQGYWEQPVEVDAREFAENVLDQYFENVA